MAWAVITGASSGIGKEFAELLAADGHDLLLIARDKTNLQRVAQTLHLEYDVGVETISADLATDKGLAVAVQAIEHSPHELDYLINSAGFGDFGELVAADSTRQASMIDLNVKALTLLCQAAAKRMVNVQAGTIINLASLAGFLPGPYMSVYYGSKNYVLSFSQALAYELEPDGIVVSALCPGPTATKFADSAKMGRSRLFKGGLASPRAIAEAGLEGARLHQAIVIPGWRNRLMVQALRLASRRAVVRWVARAQAAKE